MAHPIRKACGGLFPGLLLLIGSVTAAAHAQRAPEGPLVLRIPASARAAALANVGLALTDGDALFYNPAQLPVQRGVAASLQRASASTMAGSVATATVVGPVTIGVGVRHLRYGAAAGATFATVSDAGVAHLADAGPVHAASSAMTLGVAQTIKGVRVGAALAYAEEQVGAAVDGTLSLDVGASKVVQGITYAATVQHLGAGPRLGGVSGALPTRLSLGAGLQQAIAPLWDLGGQAAVQIDRDGGVRPAGGAELSFVPIDGVSITWRAGVRLPRERDASVVTGGLGVMIDHVLIDYAVEPMRGGRPATHRIGIRLR